jgi:hypothetical protein
VLSVVASVDCVASADCVLSLEELASEELDEGVADSVASVDCVD